MKRVSSFLTLLSLVFLAYVVGQFSAWTHAFPFEPHFRKSFVGLQAFWDQYNRLGNDYASDVWMPASMRSDSGGVTVHSAEQAAAGYTLLAVGQSAVLIDMDGRVVHRWQVSYPELMSEEAKLETPPPDTQLYWKPVRLLPQGELLVVVHRVGATPDGLALAKIDRNSQVLWVGHDYDHHDFDIDSQGNIYVLDQRIRNDELANLPRIKAPYLDEGVVVLSPDGKVLKRISTIDAFSNSPYSTMLNSLAVPNTRIWGDYLHSNNVEVIEEGLPGRAEFLKAGRVLLSFREISTIAVLDLEQAEIVWAARGVWHFQHDPDLLENGNIMLFDNQGDWGRGGQSRVLELNPETMEIVWSYPTRAKGALSSSYRSEQQLLPNGNVLINEFTSGRLLEVNKAGDIVWEYFCPFRYARNEQYVCRVMHATRYAPDEIDFEFNHAQTAAKD